MKLVRFLHVQPSATGFSGRNVVRAAVAPSSAPQFEFRALGSGVGNLVQATLPPSTPLLLRRRALAGIMVSRTDSIISRSTIAPHFFSRIWARQPLVLQRVVSSEPTTLLIGSSTSQTQSVFELDGTMDWVVKSPSCVHAYSGRALSVTTHSGWAIRTAAPPFAHTLISGRGNFVAASPGPLCSIELAANESVLVQKSNLAAYSLNPDVSLRPKSLELPYQFGTIVERPRDVVSSKNWLTRTLNSVYIGISVAIISIRNALKRGNNEFIKLYGPSTVLVTSGFVPQKELKVDSKAAALTKPDQKLE